MSENEVVRELLWKAVGTVPAPGSRGSETVFAQASRVRWRRRTAATGVVAAAVAAGLVLGPGVLNGGAGQSSVASRPTAGELTTKAAGFAKLLPAGTGKIREVSLMRLIKQVPKAPLPKPVGPYDGDYAISRHGGTGYVTVRIAVNKAVSKGEKGVPADPCGRHERPSRLDCTAEKQPNGTLLVVWSDPMKYDGQPQWGKELDADLYLKDGRVLYIRDSTGYRGPGQQGPLLSTYPLTRAELHKLALNPRLLP